MKKQEERGAFLRLVMALGGLYTTQMLAPAFMTNVTALILRNAGESLEKVSWLYAIGMIWSFNFLWAPLVDRFGPVRFGHYRGWALGMQLLLAATLFAAAFFPPLEAFGMLLLLFTAAALASSTQDIATDALGVRLLRPEQRGFGNSIQAGGNLLGGILGGGVLLVSYSRLGWQTSLFLLAACVALALLPLLRLREPPAHHSRAKAGYASIARFFKRPGIWGWIAILFVFRMVGMVTYSLLGPLLVDMGWQLAEIGIAMHLVGPIFGVFGAVCAGWLITRFSRKRAALLSMALAAVAVAVMLLPARNHAGGVAVFVTIFFLHSSYGFGCATLYTLIMDKCDPVSAGTDFSLQMSLAGAGMFVAVSPALNAVERVGYTAVLLACLVATLAFLVLIWRSRSLGPADGENAHPGAMA